MHTSFATLACFALASSVAATPVRRAASVPASSVSIEHQYCRFHVKSIDQVSQQSKYTLFKLPGYETDSLEPWISNKTNALHLGVSLCSSRAVTVADVYQ